MPSFRIGIGSDFNLSGGKVSFGSTSDTVALKVTGVLKGDFEITGVSTLRAYDGFTPQKQNVTLPSTIGFSTTGIGTFIQVDESETGFLSLVGEYNTVSEDIIVDDGKIFQVSTGSTVSVGTLESVSIQSHFSFPDGGSNDRPDQPTEGMVRFNDDLNTLEFYNGIEWRQFTVSGASGRGVFGGGYTPTVLSTIDYINISTQGNAQNFGNLTEVKRYPVSFSSSIRGLFAGGYVSSAPTYSTNVIDYITISSEGNAIDFGDLVTSTGIAAAASSSTRGIVFGGYGAPGGGLNVIQYITISTIGNSLDFGDLTSVRYGSGACNSPTRGIVAGGNPAPTNTIPTKTIEFITIASLGNAVNFGDLSQARRLDGINVSSTTRGVFGGYGYSSTSNTIDYITIASTGNAQDFGDLTTSRSLPGSCSTNIRGIFAGGRAPSPSNVIDFITISTIGNAQDFGDLTASRAACSGLSDSHGGLGGF